MFDKLQAIEERYDRLLSLIATPGVQADQNEYRTHTRELAELEPLVDRYREYKAVVAEAAQATELLEGDDADLRELAAAEVEDLNGRREKLEAAIRILLLPRDPNDEKNVVLEIRAGTGGDEAGLFAGDLFRMYKRFAEGEGWRVELLSLHETGVGAIKEVIALIEGRRVYSRLKYESGVHRVQARAGHGGERAHPHLYGDRGGAAGGGGGRHPDRPQGAAHRHLLLQRAGRPERQHDLLRGPHHAPADRPRRIAAGREVADQEQGEGDEGAALAAVRPRAAAAAERDCRGPPRAGGHGPSGPRRSAPTTFPRTG